MLKNKAAIISISLLVLLQVIKPLIVIFFYKNLTNFHPTIVNDYEIYLMVMEHISVGSMKASYTALFVLAEVLFVAIPFVIYKELSKYKA